MTSPQQGAGPHGQPTPQSQPQVQPYQSDSYSSQPYQPVGSQPGYQQVQAYRSYSDVAPQPVPATAPQQWMAPPAQQMPWAAKPKRRIVLEVVVVVLGGLLASAFVALMALATSGSSIGWAVGLALVPLVIVGAVLLWVDRWEPEPRLLMIAGFLWGGGVAVAVASFLNGVVGPAVGAAIDPGLSADNASAVYGAPIVEEAAKGLGILLIFLVRRRQFNGPVDGVVYAGVVALGFAVVEDIQYFALNSGEGLGVVFVMRALLSPFAHLIYSLPMGLALGIASRRTSRYAWVWMFPIGYLVAVGLHMAWNGSLMFASSIGDLALIFVLLNWLPLALVTWLVVWLRRRESAVIASRLRDYVPVGWLTEPEVQTLSSMRASRAARRWAKGLGAAAHASMRAYQRAAVRLAYARQDLYTGHVGIRAREDETALLEEMARARADVMARSAAQPRYAVGGHA